MAVNVPMLTLLIFAGIFAVSAAATLIFWRYWGDGKDDNPDGLREEAENLRARAETNVENAADLKSRAKRLEQMVALQRRQR